MPVKANPASDNLSDAQSGVNADDVVIIGAGRPG